MLFINDDVGGHRFLRNSTQCAVLEYHTAPQTITKSFQFHRLGDVAAHPPLAHSCSPCVLEIKLRALSVLGKRSTTELHLKPRIFFFALDSHFLSYV